MADRDNVANPIGQVLSAITPGPMTRNGEKIATSEVVRRSLDGQQVVKEQIRMMKRSIYGLSQGSRTALRTRITQRTRTAQQYHSPWKILISLLLLSKVTSFPTPGARRAFGSMDAGIANHKISL